MIPEVVEMDFAGIKLKLFDTGFLCDYVLAFESMSDSHSVDFVLLFNLMGTVFLCLNYRMDTLVKVI